MPKKNYHWYILSVRGGKEEKIIENIKLELDKKRLQDYVDDLKVFVSKSKKKILKGYIFCYCQLTPELVRFFYTVPGVVGFLDHQRKDDKMPDFISPERIKSFAGLLKEEETTSKIDQELDLNVGDLVKITTGTFINCEGRISQLDEKKQKVKIDIEFAGRMTAIDVPINNCQKVFVS